MHGLCFFECLLPIVAEAHFARRFAHLVFTPRKLLLSESDQLFGSIGNQFILQIPNQPFATTGGARDPRVVGLTRIFGGQRLSQTSEFKLGSLLDEQIIDLTVSRQVIEIERVQRRKPIVVILRIMYRQSCAASTLRAAETL